MQISAAFIYIQHDLSTQNAAAEMQTSLKLKFNWTAELRKWKKIIIIHKNQQI